MINVLITANLKLHTTFHEIQHSLANAKSKESAILALSLPFHEVSKHSLNLYTKPET